MRKETTMETTEVKQESFSLIMALFEDIKLEKQTKAGNARNRKRLQQIKSLITQAKKELM